MFLYPQLPHVVVQRALAAAIREEGALVPAIEHADQFFSATGGVPADKDHLRTLRTMLLESAKECGFPTRRDNNARTEFDYLVSAVLHKYMKITVAEAARPGVWEFISIVIAPDLVQWRFGLTEERFYAGRRNTFERLWRRSLLLSDASAGNPYELVKALGEDELVQLMERPFLTGCPAVAQEVARGFLAAIAANPAKGRRELIRESQKRLMRLSSFVSMQSLTRDELTSVIARTY